MSHALNRAHASCSMPAPVFAGTQARRPEFSRGSADRNALGRQPAWIRFFGKRARNTVVRSCATGKKAVVAEGTRRRQPQHAPLRRRGLCLRLLHLCLRSGLPLRVASSTGELESSPSRLGEPASGRCPVQASTSGRRKKGVEDNTWAL